MAGACRSSRYGRGGVALRIIASCWRRKSCLRLITIRLRGERGACGRGAEARKIADGRCVPKQPDMEEEEEEELCTVD
jgi:hypothetical protein